MRFYRNQDVYSVVRITGPQHNLLQFRLSGSATGTQQPEIRALDASDREPILDGALVRMHVLAGVARAISELGELPVIDEIGFVAADSGPEVVYEELAHALAWFIARG